MNIKHLFVHNWKILDDRIVVINYLIPGKTEVVHRITKMCTYCGKTVTTEKLIHELSGNPTRKTLKEIAEQFQKQTGATNFNYGVL
jgi:hypothetical protein